MDYLWLILLGLAAGASGGLLGIGGSVVMIPGLVILFGSHQHHLYQAAAMIVHFFVVGPSVVRHRQARATFRPVTRWMVPSAVVGAIIGVVISELHIFHGDGQGYLQLGFAVFLLYIVFYNLMRLHRGSHLPEMTEADSSRISPTKIVAMVGLPSGLFGGLLGVGGGLIAVPAQQVGLKIPLRNAIANSASMILWASIAGAIVKNARLSEHGASFRQSLLLATILAPTAIIGAYFTAARVHKWPVGIIRTAFVILLLYCTYRMFAAGWSQVSG